MVAQALDFLLLMAGLFITWTSTVHSPVLSMGHMALQITWYMTYRRELLWFSLAQLVMHWPVPLCTLPRVHDLAPLAASWPTHYVGSAHRIQEAA